MSSSSRETGFVAGGNSICGWRAGVGPPVVILHGGPGLSEYTSSLADELVDEFTVYRYQQRGLPPSTTDGPFTIESHLSDVMAVFDAIGDEQVFLVGHSWGGHLAIHVAANHPERLLGLVVVDPLGVVGDGGEADFEQSFAERLAPEAAARAAELDRRAMRGGGKQGDAMEALALVWPAYFSEPGKAPPMPKMSMSLACYSETWESIRRDLALDVLPERLSKLRAPTVFVLGADSPIPPRHGEASAALIPGAKVQILEGCGHFPWLERPGVVRAALDEIAIGS